MGPILGPSAIVTHSYLCTTDYSVNLSSVTLPLTPLRYNMM